MSIATLELTGLKIGIAAVVLAGACAATWFAADAHYSQAFSNLQGQLKGAAEVQEDELKADAKKDASVTKGVDDEAKQQIGDMADEISILSSRNADLSLRLSRSQSNGAKMPGRIVTSVSTGCPAIPDVKPDGRTATASPGSVPETTRPIEDATLSAPILDGIISVGQDAIKAELLWRKYARETGQSR